MHEDPEENRPRVADGGPDARDLVSLAPERPGDLLGIVAHAELVESVPERFQPLRPYELESPHGQNQADGRVESYECEVGYGLDERRERFVPDIVNEDLRCPQRTGHSWSQLAFGTPSACGTRAAYGPM